MSSSTEMVKSPWVYRRLRNFRAGIEAAISCFKRAYGAARCTWRGLDHFNAYIWSAEVAHNLVLFAGSNRRSRARLQADEKQTNQAALNCSFADSRPGCRCTHRPSRSCRSALATPLRKHAFMDAHELGC